MGKTQWSVLVLGKAVALLSMSCLSIRRGISPHQREHLMVALIITASSPSNDTSYLQQLLQCSHHNFSNDAV